MAKLTDTLHIPTEVLLEILIEKGMIDERYIDFDVTGVSFTVGKFEGINSTVDIHLECEVELDEVILNDQCDCEECQIDEEEKQAEDELKKLFTHLFGNNEVVYNAMNQSNDIAKTVAQNLHNYLQNH